MAAVLLVKIDIAKGVFFILRGVILYTPISPLRHKVWLNVGNPIAYTRFKDKKKNCPTPATVGSAGLTSYY